MKKYFKAFRYFTTINETHPETYNELLSLPPEILNLANQWIDSYSGFIAPSRSPLIWNESKNKIPSYCLYPQKENVLFPLSWGFDNEIFYSTIYHINLPTEYQIIGPKGKREYPSGLDIAAVLGDGFAERYLRVFGAEGDAVGAADEVGCDAAGFVDGRQSAARMCAAADQVEPGKPGCSPIFI